MTHTNLVTSELQSSGFKVRTIGQSVEVSLSNRKVRTMEVREALGQKFEEIEFNLKSTSNGILVTI